MTGSRARGVALVLTVVGAILAAASAGSTWASARVLAPIGVAEVGGTPAVAGTVLAPAFMPLLLVAAAGMLAGLFTGPRLRRSALVIAALGAVGALVAVWTGWGAAEAALTAATVPAGQPVGSLSAGAGLATSAAGAVLVLAGVVLGVCTAGRWPGAGRRYDVPVRPEGAVTTTASRDGEGPEDIQSGPGAGQRRQIADRREDSAWDALDRGDDPTL
ncbi:MAG: Trp biosynthesis-associated membrane protein [Dermatophilaceae bacterium]